MLALLLLSALALRGVHVEAGETKGTVYQNTKTGALYFKSVYDESGIAYGSFKDDLLTTGWGILKIETNAGYDDLLQMQAAGFLEGAFTWKRIYDHYTNVNAWFFPGGEAPENVIEFFAEQQNW
jgi:hypothetical protein